MLWAAAWLHKASRRRLYREYIIRNEVVLRAGDTINEFGWDNKHAGINVLISKVLTKHQKLLLSYLPTAMLINTLLGNGLIINCYYFHLCAPYV